MTPTEAFLGHTTGIRDAITGVVHNTHAQTIIHTVLTTTLHIVDHLPTEVFQLTPEITADHALN